MFERFTERARQVVVDAQNEANAAHAAVIGDGHLLLGMLHETQKNTAAYVVLHDLGLTYDEAKHFVSDHTDSVEGGREQGVQLPMSTGAKKVLELALREALSLGHNYIGTEHILLGLVREYRGVSAWYLSVSDVDAEKVRNAIIRLLSRQTQKVELPKLLSELEGHIIRAQDTLSRVRQVVDV